MKTVMQQIIIDDDSRETEDQRTNRQFSRALVKREKPRLINLRDYEEHLQNTLSKKVRDYYHSGANDMITLRENRNAFTRLTISPRVLIDVSQISTATTILGRKYNSPICIAPSAMQKMAHPEGEIATSRAAARFKTIMTLSSLSTTSMEDVIEAANQPPAIENAGGVYWFQLYAYKNQEITRDLIKRAEQSGYEAIVLTVDTPMLGRREADLRNHFSLPAHLSLENFMKYYQSHLTQSSSHPPPSEAPLSSFPESNPSDSLSMNARPTMATQDSAANNSAISNYFALLINDALTWEETIHWIKSHTKLKIILKGIITPSDALWALNYPIDGLWISNHGARQLDTTPATIEALPEIAQVIQGRMDIYLDGGIMRGTDVVKALAYGANAVFLGRPILWGLSYDGEAGVLDILELLQEEFILAMKLAGCRSLTELKRSMIRSKLSWQSNL